MKKLTIEQRLRALERDVRLLKIIIIKKEQPPQKGHIQNFLLRKNNGTDVVFSPPSL